MRLLAVAFTAGCDDELLNSRAKPDGASKVNVLPPVPSCLTTIVSARILPVDKSFVFGSVSVVAPVKVKSMLFISLSTVIEPVAEVFAVILS